MNKIVNRIFVTLGVIFAILLVSGLIVLIVNGSKSDQGVFSAENIVETYSDATGEPVVDANPSMSPAQEAALRAFGVDPATVPASITAEQEACFVAKLGATRTAEIKAGDVPTAAELFTAKACI
jgi:ABC-type Fe3+-hydroxamate transport system substrate-binding protein